jgi:small nuclear ribonucleoprotein (snRNP)-like protein
MSSSSSFDITNKKESSSSSSSVNPAMEQMKHFVDTGTTVRVSVTDGRVFTGTLGCVDKQLNVVLINATETFKKSEVRGGEKEQREPEEKEEENHETSSSRVINMALIAREHRVKMERLVEHQNEREMDEEKEKEEANKSLLESALESGLRIL